MPEDSSFMLYVFEREDYPKDKPFAVAKVRCMQCGSRYVVAVPQPDEGQPFECPECHQETRFNRVKMKGEIKP